MERDVHSLCSSKTSKQTLTLRNFLILGKNICNYKCDASNKLGKILGQGHVFNTTWTLWEQRRSLPAIFSCFMNDFSCSRVSLVISFGAYFNDFVQRWQWVRTQRQTEFLMVWERSPKPDLNSGHLFWGQQPLSIERITTGLLEPCMLHFIICQIMSMGGQLEQQTGQFSTWTLFTEPCYCSFVYFLLVDIYTMSQHFRKLGCVNNKTCGKQGLCLVFMIHSFLFF